MKLNPSEVFHDMQPDHANNNRREHQFQNCEVGEQ